MNKRIGKKVIQQMLDAADVRIDGGRPWDIQVKNSQFYDRVLEGGSLALGESYMEGWWECEAPDQFFDRILVARLDGKVKSPQGIWAKVLARIRNTQSRARAYEVGRHHYDTGNDLFSLMLDRWMNYSCAYWKNANTLDEAQEAKLDLTCRKLGLTPGMRVLDIGCGWGGFAKYAAERFQARVTGITVSQEQVESARNFCRDLPVKIEYQDYRDLKDEYDRIVSIGMFEHVGVRNYRTFMSVVYRCLETGGLFLLQTIARNTPTTSVDPWIGKYIFPNSMLPSAEQITSAAEGLLTLEDRHSFGMHYDRTLMAWHENLCRNWGRVRDRYDQSFFRMWKYYLLCCAGAFRSGKNQLWQIVFSKQGFKGGYDSIR